MTDRNDFGCQPNIPETLNEQQYDQRFPFTLQPFLLAKKISTY